MKQKKYYIGFRIEAYHKIIKNIDNKTINTYNKSKLYHIEDIQYGCKVGYKKQDDIITVNSSVNLEKQTAFSSFLLTTNDFYMEDEALRLVKIINLIGNDRLVKEMVKDFIIGESELKLLSQLNSYKEAFILADKLIPGFMSKAWYYAPELISRGV